MLVLAALLLVGAAPPDDRCTGLALRHIPAVTIEAAHLVEESFTAPDGGRIDTVPLCRIRGVARPTAASRIAFELWLPRGGWNGRYYQLGNGGFGGSIHFPSLAAEAARGNAAAITDTGHGADAFDASWAAGNPERVIDYGHRSIKATSDAAHALIAAYYGRPPTRRYFSGCSNGGRQALMAAQRYPKDWDGIIAGAPANMWTGQLTTFAALQHRLRAVPSAWLPPAKLPAIQRAALASCPPATVVQGIATQPESCRFDPGAMLCRGAEQEGCLTAPQAETLRQIQGAGFEPSSAAAPDNWSRWIVNPDPTAPSQLTFATQAFRYLLTDNPRWRVEDFDPKRDRAGLGVRAVLDADAVDFEPFRARGGRIISYFGWGDALISPRAGIDYYRRVAAGAGGIARAGAFYRLFMVPGMLHCQGGGVPDSFGQSPASPALRPDPQHDIRAALERWVERGTAPETLTAVQHRRSSPSSASFRVLRPIR